MTGRLHVLQVVAGLPSYSAPSLQPFVASQINSLTDAGVDNHVLDIRAIYGRSSKKYARGMLEVWKQVHAQRYDLVHAHYSYCGWTSRLQHSAPLVVSLMGSDVFGSFDARGNQTIRGRLDQWMSRVLARLADHIIVKSRSLAQSVPRSSKMSIVPNGVDFDLFKPLDRESSLQHFGLDRHQKAILFAANPADPRKNYSLAEKAVSLLRGKFGDECSLWTFYGREQNELSMAMNAADALLVTSLAEGSPNVVKEAMACNLPIVSVRTGDVAEVISGARNCYLADRDPVEIASKLMLILESGDRSNGRDVIPHLRLETVAAQVIHIYEQVVEHSRNRRQ